jgi:hypothetical protein
MHSLQGMCTPAEVYAGIAAEGYQISYRRVPMSRERTPQAADLDQLHLQMSNHPGGKSIVYLFLSRTATGSSARFAAAFACSALCAADEVAQEQALPGSNVVSPGSDHPLIQDDAQPTSAALSALVTPAGGVRVRPPGAPIFRMDSDLSDLVRSVEAGEYRGIMNLCRVLPHGAEAKSGVDKAIDACAVIGNIREDIMRCKEIVEGEGRESVIDAGGAAAARRLGLHYLQRYFFLIAFRAFLVAPNAAARGAVFSDWVAQRKEIQHLLSTLELE